MWIYVYCRHSKIYRKYRNSSGYSELGILFFIDVWKEIVIFSKQVDKVYFEMTQINLVEIIMACCFIT